MNFTRFGLALGMFASMATTSCRPGESLEKPTPVAPPRPTATRPGTTQGTTQGTAPTGTVRPGAPSLPRNEPLVRIGISIDSASTRVGSPGEFDVQNVAGRVIAHGNTGEAWQFTVDANGAISARNGDKVAIDAAPAPLRVVSRDMPFVTIDGRTYRGEVLLIAGRNGHITAVNTTDMESYLLGVVPREMGKRPATEIEALKAQAVAARTYAIGNMGGHSNIGFDFYATVLDQVYGGTADEDSIVTRAVRETRGQIISYRGQPILAYYASTCGGTTAAIEESWPTRAPLDYLRSRSDKVPGSEDDYYCKSSSRFTWKTEWTRQQLLDVVGSTLRAHTRGAVTSVRAVNDVQITSRGPAGRATVDLTADGRKYTLRADSIRWVLRPTTGAGLLNSSRLYSATADINSDGAVEHLTVEGGGWGHAIGMCQVGAMARARAGQSSDEILKAYYTGVTIESLYR